MPATILIQGSVLPGAVIHVHLDGRQAQRVAGPAMQAHQAAAHGIRLCLGEGRGKDRAGWLAHIHRDGDLFGVDQRADWVIHSLHIQRKFTLGRNRHHEGLQDPLLIVRFVIVDIESLFAGPAHVEEQSHRTQRCGRVGRHLDLQLDGARFAG